MKSSFMRLSLLRCLWAVLWPLAPCHPAADMVWQQPASGLWTSPASWSPAGVPGTNDWAYFGATLTTTFNPIEVNFLTDTAVGSLDVVSGNFTFTYLNPNLQIRFMDQLVVGSRKPGEPGGLSTNAALNLAFQGRLQGDNCYVGWDGGNGVRPASLNINGPETVVELDGGIYLGGASQTTLGAGAILTVNRQTDGGDLYQGTFTVSGSNSVFNALRAFHVGRNQGGQKSQFKILDKARVAVASDLSIGHGADGDLVIESSAAVDSGSGLLGQGGFGSATITGAGSTWHNKEFLHVGYLSSGYLYVGQQGSVATPGELVVGREHGPGEVLVDTGGSIHCDHASVGKEWWGFMTLRGNGSSLTCTDYLNVGTSPSTNGVLQVLAGARVQASGTLGVGINSGSGSLLADDRAEIESGNGYVAYNGTGLVTVQNNSLWRVNAGLWVGDSANSLERTGLVAVLNNGRMEIRGAAQLWRCSLTVDSTSSIHIGSGAAAAGTLTVGESGSLTGFGTITGAVVNAGGTISPNFTKGSLSIRGDFWHTNGILEVILPAFTEIPIPFPMAVAGDAVFGGTAVIKLSGSGTNMRGDYVLLRANRMVGIPAFVDETGLKLSLVATNNQLVLRIPDRSPGAQQWSFLTGGTVDSSPAIGNDGTVYVGSSDNKVYALDVSGRQKWVFASGGVNNSPAIGEDGSVYVGSLDHNIYAIDGITGAKRWQFTTGGEVRSSPGIGLDNTIYVGSDDHKVYALENATGKKQWAFATDDKVDSSPSIGTNGLIYIGSPRWKTICFGCRYGSKEMGVCGHERGAFFAGNWTRRHSLCWFPGSENIRCRWRYWLKEMGFRLGVQYLWRMVFPRDWGGWDRVCGFAFLPILCPGRPIRGAQVDVSLGKRYTLVTSHWLGRHRLCRLRRWQPLRPERINRNAAMGIQDRWPHSLFAYDWREWQRICGFVRS